MRTSEIFAAKNLKIFESYGVSRTRGWGPGLRQSGHFAVKREGDWIFFRFCANVFYGWSLTQFENFVFWIKGATRGS